MNNISEYFLDRLPSGNDGTFGFISDSNANIICATCELPWLNNETDKSCIPLGRYTVIKHNSAKHPRTWELQNVPGRSGILIHNGNTDNDSLGCIIVGKSIGKINGQRAVLNSDDTLEKLQNEFPDTFILTVE